MLKIKNGKLQVAGIEFSMPEGFYLDIEGIETVNENGLRFVFLPDECCITTSTTVRMYESSMDSLLDIFGESTMLKGVGVREFNKKDTGYKWLCDPEIREQNGLKFACVKYEGPEKCYFEMHFERIDGYDKQLEILLSVPKHNADIETVLKRTEIKVFLESIEKAE